MPSLRRAFCLIMAFMAVLGIAPLAVSADVNNPLVIEAPVLVSANTPEVKSPDNLMIQATSWRGSPYRYILTVGNFSPWVMSSLRVLDRYVPASPDKPEIDHEWLPKRMEPGQVTSFVIEFPQGPLVGGCHQIEIGIADKLGTILMDCSAPGATTVWNVPLSKEIEAYLSKPSLIQAQATGLSKVGLHVTRNSSPQIMEFVRKAQPAVVVGVGDPEWLADVKAISPKTITIGRLLEQNQVIEGDPVAKAREFVQANAGRYQTNPSVDYWLGWNEPTINNTQQMEWFAAFEAERVAAMAELGLKAAIGNFSAGTPEANEFSAFLPAIAAAKAHQGILALHEYSAPTLRDGVGAGIPDLEANAERGALTLRYRYWYEYYLRVNDLVLPLVVTEAGIDGGVLQGTGETGLMGWRDLAQRAGLNPSSPEAASQYIEQLSWYDNELRRDPYVLGFAVFNAGDTGQWKSFDVTDILPQIAEMAGGKK
jgi:hypothetical protein